MFFKNEKLDEHIFGTKVEWKVVFILAKGIVLLGHLYNK